MIAKKNHLTFTIIGILCLTICSALAMHYFLPSSSANHPHTSNGTLSDQASSHKAPATLGAAKPISANNKQISAGDKAQKGNDNFHHLQNPNTYLTLSKIIIFIVISTIIVIPIIWFVVSKQNQNDKDNQHRPSPIFNDNKEHNDNNEHIINNVNGIRLCGSSIEKPNNKKNKLSKPTDNDAKQQDRQEAKNTSSICPVYRNAQYNHNIYPPYPSKTREMEIRGIIIMLISNTIKIRIMGIITMAYLPYPMTIRRQHHQISNHLMITIAQPQCPRKTRMISNYNGYSSMSNADGLMIQLKERTGYRDKCLKLFNASLISCFGAEDNRLFMGSAEPIRVLSIRLLKQYTNTQLLMHTLFVIHHMLSGIRLQDIRKGAMVTPLDILIFKKLLSSSKDFPLYMQQIWNEFRNKQQSITINMEYIYLDYLSFRSLLFSKLITNLLLFDKIAKTFPNVNKITCTNIDCIGGGQDRYSHAVVDSYFIKGLKDSLCKIPKHTKLEEIIIRTSGNSQIKYDCKLYATQFGALGWPIEKKNKGIVLIKKPYDVPNKATESSYSSSSPSLNVSYGSQNELCNDKCREKKGGKFKKKKEKTAIGAKFGKTMGSLTKSISSKVKKFKKKNKKKGKAQKNKQLCQEMLLHSSLNKKKIG